MLTFILCALASLAYVFGFNYFKSFASKLGELDAEEFKDKK